MPSPWPMKHKVGPARSCCMLTLLKGGVASSWALARGALLADICRTAGWATPNTFARFSSLRVKPVSSCVPQTGSGTERPCSESACGVHNA